MNLKIDKVEIIPGKTCSFNIDLPESSLVYLSGLNGVGKTSLLKYILKNGKNLFDQKFILVDQLNLNPLSSYRAIDLFNILESEFSDGVLMPLEEYFKYMGVDQLNFIYLPFSKLSGGQKQLVKVFLNFYLKADVYLLDEPSQYLDQENRNRLLSVIQKVLETKRILLVDHHKEIYSQLIHQSYVMRSCDQEIWIEKDGI